MKTGVCSNRFLGKWYVKRSRLVPLPSWPFVTCVQTRTCKREKLNLYVIIISRIVFDTEQMVGLLSIPLLVSQHILFILSSNRAGLLSTGSSDASDIIYWRPQVSTRELFRSGPYCIYFLYFPDVKE